MTTTVLVTILRFGLATVFAWAAAAKLADPSASRAAVAAAGVPRWAAEPASRLLPVVELAVAGGLVLFEGAAMAMIAAGLVVVLSVGLGAALMRGTSSGCGCFGNRGPQLGWAGVARNAALAAATVALYGASV